MATCEAGTIVLISKGETEVCRAITIAQITECAVREEAALLLTSENPEEKKRLNKREKTSTGTKALVCVGGVLHLPLGAGLKAVQTPFQDGRWNDIC